MRMLGAASIIGFIIWLSRGGLEQILKFGGVGLIAIGFVALILLPFVLFFGFLGARVLGEGFERGKQAARKE